MQASLSFVLCVAFVLFNIYTTESRPTLNMAIKKHCSSAAAFVF